MGLSKTEKKEGLPVVMVMEVLEADGLVKDGKEFLGGCHKKDLVELNKHPEKSLFFSKKKLKFSKGFTDTVFRNKEVFNEQNKKTFKKDMG